MRIAICDDEKADAERLRGFIEEFARSNSLQIDNCLFQSGESFLEEEKMGAFDIAFLDIYMGELNGIETARRLKESKKSCSVVVTTNSLDHAIDGFEVNAVHYLIKPLSYEKVVKAMERCKHLFCEGDKCIEVRSERVLVRIPVKDIIFIEVFGNVILLHTKSGTIKSYTSLEEIMTDLPEEEFIRCHRSYIINLNFISEVKNTEICMIDSTSIPIRRNDRKLIKQLYANNLFRIARRAHESD